MGSTRPRLVIVKGSLPEEGSPAAALRESFEIVEAEDLPAARTLVNGDPGAILICSPQQLNALCSAPADDTPDRFALEHVAEGVGLVNEEGTLVWSNHRLSKHSAEVTKRFVEHCTTAIELYNRSADVSLPIDDIHSKEIAFSSGDSHFELVVSPASISLVPDPHIDTVVGVLWENTASRQLQNKIDAIDAAGAELLRLDSAAISNLNMAERLKYLEDRIVQSVRELLEFDNFEIRLLDSKTRRLELVIAIGISPLKIGELIYAEQEGNGISGYVAATGNSYVCPDVSKDPMYREGLETAASALTVPLRLHDRIIGVFNVESNTKAAFDDNDLLFAELFGRYIAMSMNILDLLVVERYTTNAQVSKNIVSELRAPLKTLAEQAEKLSKLSSDDKNINKLAKQILSTAGTMDARIKDCTSGPRTILETEQELHRQKRDPAMEGRRVLIADDEANIRERLKTMLEQRGCDVQIAAGGGEAIELIEAAAARGKPIEVIVSDIKMPDRNGYEVFRAARAADDNTQVILMTGFGYDPHHSIVRSVQEGLHSFLFKPFKASQFIEELTKALAAVKK